MQALWSKNEWIASLAAWALARRAVKSWVQSVREEFLINDSHTFYTVILNWLRLEWIKYMACSPYREQENPNGKWKSICNHWNWQLFPHRTSCWMISLFFVFLINFLFCAKRTMCVPIDSNIHFISSPEEISICSSLHQIKEIEKKKWNTLFSQS